MTTTDTKVFAYDERFVILHRARVACAERLGGAFALSLSVDAYADQLALGMAYKLTGEVMRESRDVSISRAVSEVLDVPVTWWDALLPSLKKAFPTFLRRLQARTRRVEVAVTHTTVNETRTCPHLEGRRDDCVRFMAWLSEGGAYTEADRQAAWRSVEAERKFRERWGK